MRKFELTGELKVAQNIVQKFFYLDRNIDTCEDNEMIDVMKKVLRKFL